MRARDEACGAVVGSKLVDHQNEAEEWPVGRFAPNVDVELLGGGVRSQRSPEERAELERPANDATACFQQRRKYVDVALIGTTIDEIDHLGRSTADSDVIAGRVECGRISVGQCIHSLRRHRAGKHDEA